MMETVEDKLRVFNLNLQEILDVTIRLQKTLDKGNIDPKTAMDQWEQRITFMQFLFRQSRAYIDRERVYAKKTYAKNEEKERLRS